MTANPSEETHVRRARAIGLSLVTVAAGALAHPNLQVGQDYSSYDILVFILNGAVLCVLLGRTAAAVFFVIRRLLRNRPIPSYAWVAPVLLIGFALGHVLYDTLFFQKFPRLVYVLTFGVPR